MPKAFGTEQDITAGIRSPNVSTGTRIGSSLSNTLLNLGQNINARTRGPSSDLAEGKFLTTALTRTESISTPAEFKKFRQDFIKQSSTRFGLGSGKNLIAQFDAQAGITESVQGGVINRFNRFTGVTTTSSDLAADELVNADDQGTVEGSLPNASFAAESVANVASDGRASVSMDDVNSWMRSAAGAVTRIQKSFTTANAIFDPETRKNSGSKLTKLAATEINNVLEDMRDNTTLQNAYNVPGGPRAITQFVSSTVNDMYDSIGPDGFEQMDVSRAEFQELVGLSSTAILEHYAAIGTVNEKDALNKSALTLDLAKNTGLINIIKSASPELGGILLNSEAMSNLGNYMTTVQNMSRQVALDPNSPMKFLVNDLTGLMGANSTIMANMETLRLSKPDSRESAISALNLFPSVMSFGPEGIEIADLWINAYENELVEFVGEPAVKSLRREIGIAKNSMQADLSSRQQTEKKIKDASDTAQVLNGTPNRTRQVISFLKGVFTDTSGAELKKDKEEDE